MHGLLLTRHCFFGDLIDGACAEKRWLLIKVVSIVE